MATSDRRAEDYESFDLLAELELDNNEFKTALLQKVLESPKDYYEMRNTVQKQLLRKATQDIYKLLIGFMYDGDLPLSGMVGPERPYVHTGDGVRLAPHIPLTQCKPKALGVAQATAKLIMDVMDEVLPPSHLELAQKRSAKRSELDTGIQF